MQIRVAMGEALHLKQEDVRLRGHAVECRIYAEDPENHFFPSPGLITRLVQPGGPGIREDCSIYEGWVVPLDYDPMLSKLVAFAETREMAIDRMLRALDEYVIGGIRTNISLFRRILMDADFRAGRIDTGYLERLLAKAPPAERETAPEDVTAVAAALLTAFGQKKIPTPHQEEDESRWAAAGRQEGVRT
jgi:acetyl-CoA carboxylase biotin carboxylase subunit